MEDQDCSSVLIVDEETTGHGRKLRAPTTHPEAAGPARVDEQYDRGSRIARFNAALAVAIIKGVGSVWCAYAFAVVALFGLPGAIQGGVSGVVQWIAQTFLQLVLLSIILVGQNVQAAASDKRALDTYIDAEAILHEVSQLHDHLLEQDNTLRQQQALLGELRDRLGEATPGLAPNKNTTSTSEV
ncbi:MAG: hypothetical protein ACRDR6_12080 [Pseudonocardiaceae bacterium]